MQEPQAKAETLCVKFRNSAPGNGSSEAGAETKKPSVFRMSGTRLEASRLSQMRGSRRRAGREEGEWSGSSWN